jgi:hypothetical protein
MASNARVESFIDEIFSVSSTLWRTALGGFFVRGLLGDGAGPGAVALVCSGEVDGSLSEEMLMY